MGFLVSNCKGCVHKNICGIKSDYDKFIAKTDNLVEDYANKSTNFDVVVECKHCKLEEP